MAECSPSPPSPRDTDFRHTLPPGPFVHARAVGWGETDPAQIVYTGQIPIMALQAIEAWFKACLGVNWYELNLDHGIGSPFVHLDCDFVAPITPRSDLLIHVLIAEIGTSSLRYRLEGRQPADRLCFTGDFVSVLVESMVLKSIPIPANFRANIERYRAHQGG